MSKIIQEKMSDTDLFMDKFDPVNSNREKRKKMRSLPSNEGGNGKKRGYSDRKVLYNDKGVLLHNQEDVCDCLTKNCPGCFFPCPKCRSPKCGLECRVNRRWVEESKEIEGTTIVVKNEFLPTK